MILRDYPSPMVSLRCWKCPRAGRYRKAALIERHGEAMNLPDLLRAVSADCPRRASLGNDPCGVHYAELAGGGAGAGSLRALVAVSDTEISAQSCWEPIDRIWQLNAKGMPKN